MKKSRLAPLGFALLLTPCALTAGQYGDFSYNRWATTVEITGYTGPGGAVSIPGAIDGLPVTYIALRAFSGCTNLTSVIMPDGLLGISSYAFSDCTGLVNATIPQSVRDIGYGAFSGCTSLIGISVDGLSRYFSAVEGVLFDEPCTTLIQFPGGKAGSYTIPSSVFRVERCAFSGCAALTSVTIPSRLTNIGSEAFSSCTSLIAITVDALNAAYSSVDGVLFDRNGTTLIQFPGGKAGGYTIPGSVLRIAPYAFSDCPSVTSVTIPDSVTGIWEGAFSDCTSLTNAIVGYNVTQIAQDTFSGCTNLTGVCFRGDAPDVGGVVFAEGAPLVVYHLPGTTGWGTAFDGHPTALWGLPSAVILTTPPNFGVGTNAYGFVISWATNASVVVEACTDLGLRDWSPLGTNTLNEGWSYFSDPEWTNHASRFYRIRSP